jgi:membrane protein implicated in regulation of membrane protease activity
MTTEPDVTSLQQAPRQKIAPGRLWALLRPYWFSEERWVGRGLLALVIGLNLASVFLTVLLAYWNRQFFDALQVKDYPTFLRLLGWFALLAACYIVVAVFALYFNQMLQIRWRRWLTDQCCRDWLTGREGKVGARGEALTELNPHGVIRCRGEEWSATADENMPAGQRVWVVALDRLSARVTRYIPDGG